MHERFGVDMIAGLGRVEPFIKGLQKCRALSRIDIVVDLTDGRLGGPKVDGFAFG